MDEKRAPFPQGPLPGKIGHFCKNVKNNVQHQNTCGFIILQKACKIREKKFLANLANF